eukprot:TRINITY_DN16964_c0_g1_i2.p1 TRINITY_DN16964_c0_g1~~TRINITY_DN16964_c0_g1_i2.p1  ORF type:complete len:117 (-),score=16.80 TRINITY_DN16964_c0_g1_i2:268-597(-)
MPVGDMDAPITPRSTLRDVPHRSTCGFSGVAVLTVLKCPGRVADGRTATLGLSILYTAVTRLLSQSSTFLVAAGFGTLTKNSWKIFDGPRSASQTAHVNTTSTMLKARK